MQRNPNFYKKSPEKKLEDINGPSPPSMILRWDLRPTSPSPGTTPLGGWLAMIATTKLLKTFHSLA
jgi:hypothetical protein